MIIKEFTIEDASGKVVTFKIAPTPIVRLVDSRRLFDAGALNTQEGMRALIAAVFWGARRAGSEITQDWLETNVDTHNAAELFELFRELNEIKPKGNGGKDNPAGEAPAAISTSSTTSPESSRMS